MNRWKMLRVGINRIFLPYYDALQSCLPAEWQPILTAITMDEEERMKTHLPKWLKAPKLGENPHLYGCAVDLGLFMQNIRVDTLPRSEIELLQHTADKLNLVWTKYESTHLELPIRSSWEKVNSVRLATGMKAALKYIESVKL